MDIMICILLLFIARILFDTEHRPASVFFTCSQSSSVGKLKMTE